MEATLSDDKVLLLEVSEACSNEDERKSRLAKRQNDLHTMLNIIGGKVDQYDYDDVLNMSTSLESIWSSLEQTYDIGRKGVQFLELQNITFDKNESPLKFYKRVYHLVMDNLYKKGETQESSSILFCRILSVSPMLVMSVCLNIAVVAFVAV